MAAKLSKASVNYRRAPLMAHKRCGTCSMFRANGKGATCTLVAGPIRRQDVCDRWAAK